MRLTKKKIVTVTVFLIITFFSIANQNANPKNTPKISQPESKAHVLRVIDGDTVELTGGTKVRYIGIDTPELHHPKIPVQCFGREAMEKNRELVEGRDVILKKDISETDKYGRLLRYVYLLNESSREGTFVNDFLVRQGYGVVDTFPPDVAHAQDFLAAQKEARENNRGLWAKCQR